MTFRLPRRCSALDSETPFHAVPILRPRRSFCPGTFLLNPSEHLNFYGVDRPPKHDDKIGHFGPKGHYSLPLSRSHATFSVGNRFAKERTMNRGLFVRSLISAGLALCLVACSGSDGKERQILHRQSTDSRCQHVALRRWHHRPTEHPPSFPKYDGGATNCTIVAPDGGAKKIVCPDGTEVVIPSAVSGWHAGSSCTVVSNGDGTSDVTCPGGDGGTTTVTVKAALVNFDSMSADNKAALDLKIAVTSVTVPASGQPVVAFRATDNATGNAVARACRRRHALRPAQAGARRPRAATTPGSATWPPTPPASPGPKPPLPPPPPTKRGADRQRRRNLRLHVPQERHRPRRTRAPRTIPLPRTAGHVDVSKRAPFAPVNVVKDFVPATGAGRHRQGREC
jgi:hypothetical protein